MTSPIIRLVPDDALIAVLSDAHIGGDPGQDIFETPDDLAALLRDLARHEGPVELVLAGDVFDLLRIAAAPAGSDKVAATIDRPEYRDLFAALREVAAREGSRVTYLPGNHDAEAWWNGAVRATLLGRGLVTDMALSLSLAFEGDPARVVYVEHGNQYDPVNAFADYDDPLDTPAGDHVVTDVLPRLPRGRTLGALHLGDLARVFPLSTVPEWIAGRLFYAYAQRAVLWLMLPLLAAYVAFEGIAYAAGSPGRPLGRLLVEVAWDCLLLVVAFGGLILLARRFANAFIGGPGAGEPDASADLIGRDLARGVAPPLAGGRVEGAIAVFVSGHTHVPSLRAFRDAQGREGVQANSGCWLRQLQPVRTRWGAPTVFASRFVQTHVRVRREAGRTRVELWEHPRPFREGLLFVEWLVVAEHHLHKRDADRTPRVIAARALPP